MAVYKVPQDVEAEDKLIGPFGFRQFIYLIIVAFACFVAYVLSKIFIGLILIPAPFIVFFAAIALPLRKDQPTETYLAAILQFHLKPKKRLWMPDGVLSTVEITAPKKIEERRTKDITEDEALDRLDNLSQIMDTRGWSARGVFNSDVNSTGNINLAESVVAEADNATDILEATSFDKLIDKQKATSQKTAMDRMQKAAIPVASKPTTKTPPLLTKPNSDIAQAVASLQASDNSATDDIATNVTYNPYPKAIHQAVIQPIGSKTQATPISDNDSSAQSTSDNTPSPDIIKLANNSEGLKISTIAKQANRIVEKQTEEVEVKLH